MAEERDACPGCGQPRSETFNPANAEAYTVQRLGICAGCYVKDYVAKDAPEGTQFRVHRRHNLMEGHGG